MLPLTVNVGIYNTILSCSSFSAHTEPCSNAACVDLQLEQILRLNTLLAQRKQMPSSPLHTVTLYHQYAVNAARPLEIVQTSERTIRLPMCSSVILLYSVWVELNPMMIPSLVVQRVLVMQYIQRCGGSDLVYETMMIPRAGSPMFST